MLAIANEVIESRSRLKLKWFLATYLSCASPKEILNGLQFTLVQLPGNSQVRIGELQVPVFDIYEGHLYKILFDGFTVDSYTFKVNDHSVLRHAIDKFGPIFSKHISANGVFGVHMLRQLRLYSAIHDYPDKNIPREIIPLVYGLGQYSMPRMPKQKAGEALLRIMPGFHLTQSIL